MTYARVRSAICAVVAAFALAGLSAWPAAAQAPPLGEVARKEAERRKEQAPAGKVYTNKDLPASAQDRGPVPSPYGEPAADDATADKPGAGETASKGSDAPEQPVRDEAWWRDRVTKAREDVRANEIAAESLQAQINALGRDFVSRDNPVRRAQIGEERGQALEELSRLRAAIERGRQEIDAIEEEARRSGVPPGWLR